MPPGDGSCRGIGQHMGNDSGPSGTGSDTLGSEVGTAIVVPAVDPVAVAAAAPGEDGLPGRRRRSEGSECRLDEAEHRRQVEQLAGHGPELVGVSDICDPLATVLVLELERSDAATTVHDVDLALLEQQLAYQWHVVADERN